MDLNPVREMLGAASDLLEEIDETVHALVNSGLEFLTKADEQLSRLGEGPVVEEPEAEDPVEEAIKNMASRLNISEDYARKLLTVVEAADAAVRASAKKNNSPYDTP